MFAEHLWTRSEILSKADTEAKRLKYDIENRSVPFNIYNVNRKDYVCSNKKNSPSTQNGEYSLKDKEYLAVYYAPLKGGLGADALEISCRWVYSIRIIVGVNSVLPGARPTLRRKRLEILDEH